MNINEIIKNEIDAALADARIRRNTAKNVFLDLEKRVIALEKSSVCNHCFDSSSSGWLQIGIDNCSKCGWQHVY